jgi:hypothetical protein
MSECDKLQNFWFGCCDCERVENCEAASVIKLLAEAKEVGGMDCDNPPGSPSTWEQVTFWMRR